MVNGNEQLAINNEQLAIIPTQLMENSNLLDLLTAGIAVAILIGGFLMMFTTIFTTKRKRGE